MLFEERKTIASVRFGYGGSRPYEGGTIRFVYVLLFFLLLAAASNHEIKIEELVDLNFCSSDRLQISTDGLC